MDERKLAGWLRTASAGGKRACIGLDGFVDRVLRVVDSRLDSSNVTYIGTLLDYGRRLQAAAGMSLNIELIPRSTRHGGNGPIMAYALARLGAAVTCWGTLGYPEISPVFEPLGEIAELRSVGEPGFTDAYEFDDGKLIASVLEPLNNLNWESIIGRIGRDELTAMLDGADLIALNNWTMLPCMTDVWHRLQAEVLPGLRQKNRLFFLDLADPAKRTEADLREALGAAGGFSRYGDVLLSCNYSEAVQIASALGLRPEGREEDLCAAIRRETGLRWVSIHTRTGAFTCGGEQSVSARGFFTERPYISVGGGDHFNAGLAFGLLEGLELDGALLLGNAVAGCYVRSGISPDARQLAGFLDSLSEI